MTTINEYEIKELAYYLWISEGKPEGQSDKHWATATKMVVEQNRSGHQAPKRSVDPSEKKGQMEPEQPDQT
jgi:hypothetical protein